MAHPSVAAQRCSGSQRSTVRGSHIAASAQLREPAQVDRSKWRLGAVGVGAVIQEQPAVREEEPTLPRAAPHAVAVAFFEGSRQLQGNGYGAEACAGSEL
jgi:hypothetical protein